MTYLNLDDFYRDVARILHLLARRFPTPTELYVEDIYRSEEPDEYGLHSARWLACFSTLLWLKDEGYLRFADAVRQEHVEQAVLTGRCLSVLLSPMPVCGQAESGLPESVAAERATLLAQLEEQLSERSSTKLAAIVRTAMSRMLTAGLSPQAEATR